MSALGMASMAITATAEITGTPGPTPTAGPTFTPPPPPNDGPDHLWFRRPVNEGVTWTDKHYPYGSTRGGTLRPHHGVEFNVGYNTPIVAVAAGTVRVAGDDSTVAYGPHTNFYGNLVVIEHEYTAGGLPLFSLYAHLNEVLVSEGQQVATGAVIGLSGATGVADGPHVHLEVRVGANSYDNTRNPLLWLFPFPDRGVIAGRVVFASGEPAREAPVSIRRVDGPNPYQGTTTYAGTSVNPDPHWQENFVIDDVTAGFYEVIVNTGDKPVKVETWVYPYKTSFVEIVLP
jgi:murein DD-endopeptidase MepM/ murein hydrolase activator NlpD